MIRTTILDRSEKVLPIPTFSMLYMKCVSHLFFRAAFGKESEVLIGNLGDKLIPAQDILRDVSDLKALANMHESLEWLAGRTKLAFSNLSTAQSKYLVGERLWGQLRS